jgi:hypothetical protein
MKLPLSHCNRLIDTGYNLLTVGDNKIPNMPWKKYQSEKITKAEFEKRYYQQESTYTDKHGNERKVEETKNVGIITGFFDVEAIDVDLKVIPSLSERQQFWENLISYLKLHIFDFDNKFVIYQTISGGYHIIYRCKKIEGNKKIAKLRGQTEAVIETRGIGGYIFVYENKVSKKGYNEITEISPDDRDELMACCKMFDCAENETPISIPDYSDKTPWEDYNAKTSIFDLISNEFTIEHKLPNKIFIKRTGSDKPHSGYVFTDTGKMYLFSTGTIYPAEKILSAFDVFAWQNWNGDLKKAAKDLYHKGYGKRMVKKPDIIQEPIEIPKINATFPIEIFPPQIQRYIVECNKTLDSSVEYMGAAMLWLFSVIIGNSIKVEVKKGWVESCTLWLSIVGKAGIGKTPSINNVVFPLFKSNNKEIKRFIKQSQKYDAYNKLDKEDKMLAEEIKAPRKTQFIVNDITLEALVDLHEDNKNSVGVFKDELAGFFKDMNKYRSGSDLEFWLSSWSNKGVSLNRKTAKSSFVESPIIPIIGGIQPPILTQFFTQENKDNGFIDRMLLVYPDLQVEKYNEAEMDQALINWYNDSIILCYDAVKNDFLQYDDEGEIISEIIRFEPDAKQEWVRIYNKLTDMQNDESESEYFKSMLPKQKSYIPRFALILAFMKVLESGDTNIEIDRDVMLNAEKLSDYFILQAKKIKFDSIERSEAKKTISMMRDKTKKEQCIEILKLNPSISKKELAEILEVSRQQIYNYINETTPLQPH